MKHRLQRFLSGFLAAAIGLSVITTALPAPVFAAEPITDLLEQGGWVVKKGDTVSSAKETGYTELVTQGGREMTLVTAGPNNGNGHFNPSGTPEAFYLTDSAYTNEAFSVRLVLKSEKAQTRLRVVNKYADDSHWSYLAYDGAGNGNWFAEYKNGDASGYPGMTGLPALNAGDEVVISGEWSGEGLNVTVENETTQKSGSFTVTDPNFVGLKDQSGKMGIGAGTYSTEYTAVYFSDLTIDAQPYSGDYVWYRDIDGQTAEKASVGGTFQHRLVAAGNENGNTKTDKAYVIAPSVQGVKAGTLETTFRVPVADTGKNSLKYAVLFHYTDANHWAAVGHDGSKWYVQAVNGTTNTVKELSGITAKPAEKITLSVSYTADQIASVTINGKKAVFEQPDGFTGLAGGKIGYLLSQNTRLEVSQLSFTNDGSGTDPEPPVEGGRKWIAFNSVGGGHSYGQANGPAVVIDPNKTIQEADKLSLKFRPTTETKNFGIFYYYLDDSNWLYVGYDASSGWYYQFMNNGSGEYPKLDGLPAPVTGESMEIEISLSRETLQVTVDGFSSTKPNSNLNISKL